MHDAVEACSEFMTTVMCKFTGGIIWEVEGRGSGGKGVAYHTDSPTQVDLGWWVCMICYPLTTTPPTFHLPNNTACV